MLRRLTALLALLWLWPADAVLAQRSAYPSLMPRPVESRDREAEVAAAAAARQTEAEAVAEDMALAAEVAALSVRARVGAAAFDARLESGRRTVEAGQTAPIGSESWVVAERAISALDAERYDSVAALASLDVLYAERSIAENAGRAIADAATIAPARRQVVAMVDRQNDILDELRRALPQP